MFRPLNNELLQDLLAPAIAKIGANQAKSAES